MRFTSSLAAFSFLSSLSSLALATDCKFWNGDGVWGPEFPLKQQGSAEEWAIPQFNINDARYDLRVNFKAGGDLQLSSTGSFGAPVPFHQFRFDIHLKNKMGTRSFWSATDVCLLRVDHLDPKVLFFDFDVESVSVFARQ